MSPSELVTATLSRSAYSLKISNSRSVNSYDRTEALVSTSPTTSWPASTTLIPATTMSSLPLIQRSCQDAGVRKSISVGFSISDLVLLLLGTIFVSSGERVEGQIPGRVKPRNYE